MIFKFKLPKVSLIKKDTPVFVSLYSSKSGFTLIELLIVIVLIGILSGVVVTVINPIAQQNRARDAVTVSSINKLVLSTEAYVSAYSISPTPQEFMAGISNASVLSDAKCQNNTCLFSLEATTLPKSCNSDFYGEGTNQCYFLYERVEDSSDFYIYAKAYGTNRLYVYKSSQSENKFLLCPNEYPIYDESTCSSL